MAAASIDYFASLGHLAERRSQTSATSEIVANGATLTSTSHPRERKRLRSFLLDHRIAGCIEDVALPP